MNKTARIELRVTPVLKSRVSVAAVKQGVSSQVFIERALEAALSGDERELAAGTSPAPAPVSPARDVRPVAASPRASVGMDRQRKLNAKRAK